MIPYTKSAIHGLLKTMDDDALEKVDHTYFQRWPAAVIEKGELIKELITNEKARRLK